MCMTRIAVVSKKKCNPKECGWVCIKFCPGVRMGDETITQAEDKYPYIAEELCTGCGICVKKCPFGAVSIINLPEELENPLHQYGANSFRIYNMPCPQKGIVGLVGQNGIGKTTLLNILAGHMVPNFGDYSKKGNWDSVIEKFHGHELQSYLEDLKEKKIELSYKLQNVTKIQNVFKGSVKELIEKTDEKGITNKLIKEFELEKCKDTLISDVSGGELQRTAIAAAISKDAEVYFFDEPSSFLDVKQRLKVAKKIRELGENKKILVVEHDLAVLDYLTDYVHILYGKQGCYGVVSSLKNSRVGINEFLDGYLKNENVRIRDYDIKFEVKPPSDQSTQITNYTYDKFTKKYKNFELNSEGAEIKQGEVVSILGPNAIGKTTYMKVLTGVEKSTSGNPGLKAKISYKPQYLEANSKLTVQQFVMSQKDIDLEIFESDLKRHIFDLYPRKMNELSGGELQRVMVIIAISKECDICMLDEPSAFLDIEQRLNLAQVLRRITSKKSISTMVIDHDIVFQDMCGDRIMLFEGIPAKKGAAKTPISMHEGMNSFLKEMDVTFRRDPNSGRPRANKPKSQKDQDQRRRNEYYYVLE